VRRLRENDPRTTLRITFTIMTLALSVLAGAASASPVTAGPAFATDAVCAAAEKAQRERALSRYQRTMIVDRRAFFRTHKSLGIRRRFVRRQQAKLRALRRAAACTVVSAGARIAAEIAVPNDGGIGAGAGSVWVVDRSYGLLRIDPATNSVAARIAGVRGGAPVVGEGTVWVPSAIIFNTLLRVDLATGAVTRIATGPSADEWPITAVVTPGAVWVGNHHGGSVARVDPHTNALVASVPWGEHGNGGIYHMATDGSRIWVTGSRTADVTEIDTATNSVVGRTTVPTGTCGGIAVDAAAVWVASGYDRPYGCWNTTSWGVSRIDRATGAVTRIDVGGRPIDVRVGLGSVWVVVDAPSLQLVRLDLATYQVVGRLSLAPDRCTPETTGFCAGGEYATALAVAFDSVWVRVSAPGAAGKVLRIEPNP
jgi:streptogramin lyase